MSRPVRRGQHVTSSPKIWLVHAGRVSMAPIADAFSRHWPEAQLAHLLDGSLADDAQSAGELTPGLIERFCLLGRYCVGVGADAIMFTCATFGAAIDAVKAEQRIPVLKPNEALGEALTRQPGRIALLGTFADSLPALMAEVDACLPAGAARPGIDTHVVAGAFDALLQGDADAHDRLIAEAAGRFAGYDAIAFSQFSMARAAGLAGQRAAQPILTTPRASVDKLRALLA